MFSFLVLGLAIGNASDAESFFELKIRPVLAEHCSRCHGSKKASNDLRLDSRLALLKGGRSGPAILAGDPQRSLLLQALRQTHDSIKMPPGKKLPEQIVGDFENWIRHGAPWPAESKQLAGKEHWAFSPIQAVAPPEDPSRRAINPIDRFVARGWLKQGLHPAPQADRRTLLRRLYFDLLGLPPSPEEVDSFLNDPSADAYAKVVECLLASPHYGERWGRHWMDVVRYADTAGDNADYPVPEARLYRDYIIDAFNKDKPYNQFVREQLAGDLLAAREPSEKRAEQIIATGFLALSRRYATGPYELWHLTLEDTIETTGRAFLGLTMRCARCHDHKFDPIPREDYYALYGIFASTQFPWAGAEEFASMHKPREHFVSLAPPEETAARLKAHQESIKKLDLELEQAQKANAPQKQLDSLRNTLRQLRRPGLPRDLPGAYAVADARPVDAAIHIAGDVGRPGDVVRRGVPRFLDGDWEPSIPAKSSGRLELAEWMVHPDHPLTARVMVNRIWQHHFGKGIVPTPSNFGTRGEEPTHPELLDWLARRFVDSGWSIKAMHRLIVHSKVYQLASADDASNAVKDPSNRYYWRFERRRLDAESIRDAMLIASGRLKLERPGAHPFPPIEKWGWTQHTPFKDLYPSQHRSVYLMTQRFQRHPFLALFDGPDTNTSTEQRSTSIVPQQALYLMNNVFVAEQAEALAKRILHEADSLDERIDLAYRLAYARSANVLELERTQRYLAEYAQHSKAESDAWTSLARVLLCGHEFVYVD